MKIGNGPPPFEKKWFVYVEPDSAAFIGPYHSKELAQLSAIGIVVAEASIRPDALKQIADILDPEDVHHDDDSSAIK